MFLFMDTELDKSDEGRQNWNLREICLILDNDFRMTVGKLLLKHGENGVYFEYLNSARTRQETQKLNNFSFRLNRCIKELCSQAQFLIAHNSRHDCKVLKWVYNNFTLGGDLPWSSGTSSICTMEHSTRVCKIGPGPDWKWPSLKEAYSQLCDPQGFGKGHTAEVDTLACRRLFYALLDGGYIASLSHLKRKVKA